MLLRYIVGYTALGRAVENFLYRKQDQWTLKLWIQLMGLVEPCVSVLTKNALN